MLIIKDISLQMSQMSQDEISIIILTNKIASGISIFSCIFILLIHWFFKEIRSFVLSMIMWLCLSNIIYCLSAYIPYNNIREDNLTWCAIQAFTILTFQYSSWILACIIGYCCFISVIKTNHLEKNHNIYRFCFLFFTLIVSLGLASIILFTDTFGPTGGWCWVDVYRNNQPLIHKLILFYYCANWFFIILNTFFIFKVICVLNNEDNLTPKRVYLLSVYQILKWFPIVQIICILPSTVNRLFNVFNKQPEFPLLILQTVFGSTIGLGYFLIYLRIPVVKNSLKVFFNKICCKKFFNNDHIMINSNLDSYDFCSI